MPTPLDLLIGPALRYPQGPHIEDAPGSRMPRTPFLRTAGIVAGAVAIGWAARAVARRGRTG